MLKSRLTSREPLGLISPCKLMKTTFPIGSNEALRPVEKENKNTAGTSTKICMERAAAISSTRLVLY